MYRVYFKNKKQQKNTQKILLQGIKISHQKMRKYSTVNKF